MHPRCFTTAVPRPLRPLCHGFTTAMPRRATAVPRFYDRYATPCDRCATALDDLSRTFYDRYATVIPVAERHALCLPYQFPKLQ
jgi:hypothetical protein